MRCLPRELGGAISATERYLQKKSIECSGSRGKNKFGRFSVQNSIKLRNKMKFIRSTSESNDRGYFVYFNHMEEYIALDPTKPTRWETVSKICVLICI